MPALSDSSNMCVFDPLRGKARGRRQDAVTLDGSGGHAHAGGDSLLSSSLIFSRLLVASYLLMTMLTQVGYWHAEAMPKAIRQAESPPPLNAYQRGFCPLLDPFTGGGTLAIEGAMMVTGEDHRPRPQAEPGTFRRRRRCCCSAAAGVCCCGWCCCWRLLRF